MGRKRSGKVRTPRLPDELIWEILLRVPVKSLLEFKSVCKSWKTLISHPQFVKDHLLRTSTHMIDQRLISPNSDYPFKIASFSLQSLLQNPSTQAEPHFIEMRDKFHILGSCNGLICVEHAFRGYVQLWNPSIGIASKKFRPHGSRYIAYHGFGYDHVNDKYKLFLFLKYSRPAVTIIYTFGANATNCSKVIQNFPCNVIMENGIFVSGTGTLNWVAHDGPRWFIISLDLVTETYGEVLLPHVDSLAFRVPELLLLSNCLCVNMYNDHTDDWGLWQMKEYGVQDSWTKLMSISIFQVFSSLRAWKWLYYGHVPLCISENGMVLIQVHADSQLVLFHSNAGSWDTTILSGDHRWCDVQTYHESLVSPQF